MSTPSTDTDTVCRRLSAVASPTTSAHQNTEHSHITLNHIMQLSAVHQSQQHIAKVNKMQLN